jgi:hypothetical protein
MNGNVIETLRELSNREKLEPEVAQPIILGVLADIYEAVNTLRTERENDWADMEKNREMYRVERETQVKLLEQMSDKIDDIDCKVKELSSNPAIQVGLFTLRYKTMTRIVIVGTIVLLSLWAIPGIRLWVFSDILHLPGVVIDFLMAYPTPTPTIK